MKQAKSESKYQRLPELLLSKSEIVLYDSLIKLNDDGREARLWENLMLAFKYRADALGMTYLEYFLKAREDSRLPEGLDVEAAENLRIVEVARLARARAAQAFLNKANELKAGQILPGTIKMAAREILTAWRAERMEALADQLLGDLMACREVIGEGLPALIHAVTDADCPISRMLYGAYRLTDHKRPASFGMTDAAATAMMTGAMRLMPSSDLRTMAGLMSIMVGKSNLMATIVARQARLCASCDEQLMSTMKAVVKEEIGVVPSRLGLNQMGIVMVYVPEVDRPSDQIMAQLVIRLNEVLQTTLEGTGTNLNDEYGVMLVDEETGERI